MKKREWIIVFLLLLISASALFVCLSGRRDGAKVFVRQDGEVIREYALDETVRETITTNDGSNTFAIQNHTVIMLESNCPNHNCIRQGVIAKTGESIVCLPHKLIITIE
ncbi:MAG: NusG domain II-containing protein [Lachnospiraceae bacterium]